MTVKRFILIGWAIEAATLIPCLVFANHPAQVFIIATFAELLSFSLFVLIGTSIVRWIKGQEACEEWANKFIPLPHD